MKKGTAVAYETHTSRRLENFDWIADNVSNICSKSVGKKSGKTGVYNVFMDQFAASSLFGMLTNSFYATNIQQGNSKLIGAKGQQFFSKKLTINDHGILDYGLFTNTADDEGSPRKNKTLVDKGVVKNYLYDHTTAMKEGVKSTGNFSNLVQRPSIAETNFIIKPGRRKTSEILSDFDGVYINTLVGTHTANPVSGDFSVNTENAFLIKKGKWIPLKHVMVAGNVFELLRRIEEIGKESRQESSIVCSPTVISDVQIIA